MMVLVWNLLTLATGSQQLLRLSSYRDMINWVKLPLLHLLSNKINSSWRKNIVMQLAYSANAMQLLSYRLLSAFCCTILGFKLSKPTKCFNKKSKHLFLALPPAPGGLINSALALVWARWQYYRRPAKKCFCENVAVYILPGVALAPSALPG